MLNINKTVNYNGESVSEDGSVLAYMNASIDANGIISINKNTASKNAYVNYSDVIDADWAEFESQVKAALEEMIAETDAETDFEEDSKEDSDEDVEDATEATE